MHPFAHYRPKLRAPKPVRPCRGRPKCRSTFPANRGALTVGLQKEATNTVGLKARHPGPSTAPRMQQPRRVLSHPGDVLQLVQADLKPRETQNCRIDYSRLPNLWIVRIGAWLVSTPGMIGSLGQTLRQRSRKTALHSMPRLQHLQRCHSYQDLGALTFFSGTVCQRTN